MLVTLTALESICTRGSKSRGLNSKSKLDLWRDLLHAPLYLKRQVAGWHASVIGPTVTLRLRPSRLVGKCRFREPPYGVGRLV